MFILIENKRAQHPFYHEVIGVSLYTLEELAWFIRHHMYLVDASWVGEDLFSWLEKELGQDVLAARVRAELRSSGDAFLCARKILEHCGLYGAEDLAAVDREIPGMQNRTSMERRKFRGDLLFLEGRYRRAAYLYLELLRPENARRMTEELRGDIFHNLGVVYARFFLFEEAAEMFSEAYRLRKKEASRDAYLYAMNFVGETATLDHQHMDLNFSVMRDALQRFGDASENQENAKERRAAASAAAAFDWKNSQEALIRRWREECTKMTG